MDQAGGQSDSDDGNSDVDDEDDDDDDDDDAGGRGEDGEDEETREKKDKVKQLNSEIKALEAAIEKKKSGFSGGNPIMMVSLLAPVLVVLTMCKADELETFRGSYSGYAIGFERENYGPTGIDG